MNGLEKEHGHTHVGLYVQAMAKWLAVALVTGVCCGVVGSLFHIGVERATELREQHPWLLWCLPAAGLVIVAFYISALRILGCATPKRSIRVRRILNVLSMAPSAS